MLDFVLLSSIVLTGKQRLCLKRFLPTSFRLAGLYLCDRVTSPVGSWLLGGYLISTMLHCALQVWRRILMDEVTGFSLYMFGRLALSLDKRMHASKKYIETSWTSTLYRSTFIWDWGTISTYSYSMNPSASIWWKKEAGHTTSTQLHQAFPSEVVYSEHFHNN